MIFFLSKQLIAALVLKITSAFMSTWKMIKAWLWSQNKQYFCLHVCSGMLCVCAICHITELTTGSSHSWQTRCNQHTVSVPWCVMCVSAWVDMCVGGYCTTFRTCLCVAGGDRQVCWRASVLQSLSDKAKTHNQLKWAVSAFLWMVNR